MSSPFVAQAMSLGQLFADPSFIHVPAYQRSFAWTSDEAGQLLDDVSEAMEAEGDSDQSGDYFLGPMLFSEPDPPAGRLAAWKAARAGRFHEVVDGLQRLTTLTILFCVLRDLGEERTEPANERLLAAIGGAGAGARNRLTLREPDEAFFHAHVRGRGATRIDPAGSSPSPAAQRILEVRNHLRETLIEYEPAQRRQLADFLLDKCHIVLVSATGIDRAHRMFTVLNATGRPLARNDILKATLLGTVPAAGLHQATAAWDEAQARLGDDFDSLFSHIRTIYRRNSAHIISGIKSIAEEHGGSGVFIARSLRPAAAIFEDLRAARHAGSPHSDAIVASLEYLGWLKGSDWVPPAMLWWLKRGDDPAGLAWFLAALDRLAYGLRILGVGTKRRVARLATVVQAIHQGQDLDGPASALHLTREEQANIHYNLRDLHARSAPTAKLVLLRLNDQMAGRRQRLALGDLTVEHLLPRKPGANSRWREWFPDPTERGRCTESLGNLVLMTKAQNDKAGNLDFARKQDVLFKTAGAPPLPINDWVRGQPEWLAAQINEREADLLRRLDRLWQIGPPHRRAEAA